MQPGSKEAGGRGHLICRAEMENISPGPEFPTEMTEDQYRTTASHSTLWPNMRRWYRRLDIEDYGIQPVPEELRTDQHPLDLFTVFFAANCNTATLATGFLGPTTFGLGWWDSFLAIVLFNILGAVFPALAARFGPKLGLRTMVVPRYSFGWWPSKVLAFLYLMNMLGWSIVNALSGASVLHDVGSGKLPMAISVLIVGLVAITLGLCGYRVLHTYTRYSWIVMMTCFCITAGFGAQKFVNVPMGHGATEASNVLSFSTSIIGFEAAWAPMAADYGVYIRPEIDDRTTLSYAYGGLLSSQVLVELLGAAIGTLISSPDPRFQTLYDERGMGGLVGSVFEDQAPGIREFGYLVEFLLGLSTAAVTTANLYSLGLSVQMTSTTFLRVSRLAWSFAGSIVFLDLSMAARDYLEDVLTDFLLICAYWLVPFCTVFFLEHFIWRRGYRYDLSVWNVPSQLPYGFAAATAWVLGTVVAIISMNQTWWTGPIASWIGGKNGTDISWILAAAVSGVLYVPLRLWERRIWNL